MHCDGERRNQCAPREKLFEIVSDVTRHPQMAGSGEVQRVEWMTPLPVRVGSQFKSLQKIGMEYPTEIIGCGV